MVNSELHNCTAGNLAIVACGGRPKKAKLVLLLPFSWFSPGNDKSFNQLGN